MKLFYIILLALFFASCASPYTQEELNSEFKLDDFKNSYDLRDEKTDSLFDIFNDDELKKLIDMALLKNSDIFIYDSRLKIAESQLKIAISNLMPSVNGDIGYRFNGDSSIDTSLMASWELDLFGKYTNAKNAYEEKLNIANENLEFFKISLVSDIALAYFNLKYLQSDILLTQERITNYKELVSVMNTMYESGFINFSDFMENKALLQSEEQNLNNLLNDYESKKNEIRILINDKDYEFTNSNYEFSIPKFYVNLDNSADIILNRPDIKSQISNLNAAIYNLNSTKASAYPTIQISGSLSKALLSPNGITDLAYQILSSLTLPLFSRMEIYENIKISDYTRLEAYYTLEKAIYTALSEIENAIYALNANKNTLNTSLQMLEDNEEILSTLKQSYELGLIDFSEYIQAINSHLSMMKNNNASYFNIISATIYLYRSIGGNKNDIRKNDE